MSHEQPPAKPSFRFFRHAPAAGGDQAENLFHSLQTFESSLLLLAYRQYPSALIQSVAAIENLLRGHGEPGMTDIEPLEGAPLELVCRKFPELKKICDRTSLREAIRSGHRLQQSGLSPRDDEASVVAFMGSTLPFYRACFEHMHGFDLFEALYEDYRGHIDLARRAFYEAGERNDLSTRIPAISALTAFMRWQELRNTAPDGGLNFLSGCSEEGFERVARDKDALEATSSNSWEVECPVCESPGNMIVALDGEALEQARITGQHATCANCGYSIGGPWGFMVNILLGSQLKASRREILRKLAGIVFDPDPVI